MAVVVVLLVLLGTVNMKPALLGLLQLLLCLILNLVEVLIVVEQVPHFKHRLGVEGLVEVRRTQVPILSL
jgi:hypothetical protein